MIFHRGLMYLRGQRLIYLIGQRLIYLLGPRLTYSTYEDIG